MKIPFGARNHGVVTGRVGYIWGKQRVLNPESKTHYRKLSLHAVDGCGVIEINFFNEDADLLDGIVIGMYVNVLVRITGRGAMGSSARFLNLTGKDIEVSQSVST